MSAPTDGGFVTIEIRGLPLELHGRAQAHGDELMREFRLLTEQVRQEPESHVPGRLLELVQTLEAAYGGLTASQDDAVEAAMTRGDPTIDLTYELPPGVADAAGALGRLLDEADEYCREGEHLLTLATPPDCVAYRRWFLAEFDRQAHGAPPTAWSDSAFAQEVSAAG